MKQILIVFSCFLSLFSAHSQSPREKKYPSLLWEISGRGLKKPSFLIGTMHVSNKLAFNLPDSFYYAIRNAEVVALETNPETWQEDLTKYDLSGAEDYGSSEGLDYDYLPSEYFNISALKFYRYYSKVQRALSSSPSAINNLLYRSYGDQASDFEEDTYLDMYIFQCGKKWGKKIAGVEGFEESMQLMAEAYRDAAKDKNKKDRSYGDWENSLSDDKLQEAYRLGNLDLLDSINRYNSTSDAFDEKFIYRRNEIQANSIDSIIRSGSSLFVGVGAAHLPGKRGVIELLRRKGYKLRPVKMGERASRQKELVDKIRVPVTFHTETADDGFFKVDVPGKLFRVAEDPALKQQQFADMANGSYYMVTRIMSNAWMWNQEEGEVLAKIDSLLYENIPGKIISKTNIVRNGYRGLDIVNRTRRGDMQRYNIFVTPFEVLFFKISGNGDYVKTGTEADKFFSSIQLKEYSNQSSNWKRYTPPFGGFSVDLPHDPYIGNDGSWIFDAEDKASGTEFRVIRTDVPNFHFIEEDSFDLGLMNESFLASSFIDSQLLRKQTTFQGYPALEGKYLDKYGQLYLTRFIVQGPHYYSLIARGKKENESMGRFMNSFGISPLVYETARAYKDTNLYYTVNTSVRPDEKLVKIRIPKYSWWNTDAGEDELSENERLKNGVYRSQSFVNDSTGESISVFFFHSNRYEKQKDSLAFTERIPWGSLLDTAVLVKRNDLQNKGIKEWENFITDTNSSRKLWVRNYYRNGTGYSISTLVDTVTAPSGFIRSFFDSFRPWAEMPGSESPADPSTLFFSELMSKDTVLHTRALRHIDDVELNVTDLPLLKRAINSLDWNEKKYLDTKVSLIDKLGEIKNEKAAELLEQYYYAAGDTIQLQYAALENLLQQGSAQAFKIFGRIMSNEPPVLEPSRSILSVYSSVLGTNDSDVDNGNFMDELFDSLQLTRSILPDLLPLINLRDYQMPVMKLLARMLDSNLVKGTDYKEYFTKLYIEAKQELKKQSISEKKKAIEKAEKNKLDPKSPDYTEESDQGNADLALYATLLLPFESQNSGVTSFLSQLAATNDKKLRLATVLLLTRNGRPVADSLIESLASDNNYRFELYRQLKKMGALEKFPARWNDHIELGKSVLVYSKTYDKPDTIVYLDKRKLSYENKTGLVYFYKYKLKKDDINWKIAMVGLVPPDPKEFDADIPLRFNYLMKYEGLTRATDTKLKDDASVSQQLDKLIHEWLVTKRKSGKEFYTGKEEEEEE